MELPEDAHTNLQEGVFRLLKEVLVFPARPKSEFSSKWVSLKRPVSANKVLSEKEDIFLPHLGSERMIYSKIIGKEKELDKLELQVRKVINGKGSVANILDEAVIGKSRLMAELKRREVMKRVSLLGSTVCTGWFGL